MKGRVFLDNRTAPGGAVILCRNTSLAAPLTVFALTAVGFGLLAVTAVAGVAAANPVPSLDRVADELGDPDRIPKVLKALEELWRKDPDLRLGQLVVNATKQSGRNVVCPEIFHIEDDEMLKGIQRYLETFAARQKNEKPA